MKKILLIFLLTPVLTKAQTSRTTANNGVNGVARTALSDHSSSLPMDSKALIVVDGVIRNSSEQQSLASTVSFGNKPNAIDPDKIESMTVLTGTEAIALYGSRGTNGAIVVTTQKQKK